MLPLVLPEMATSHALVHAAHDDEMKAPHVPAGLREKPWVYATRIVVSEVGGAALDVVFQRRC